MSTNTWAIIISVNNISPSISSQAGSSIPILTICITPHNAQVILLPLSLQHNHSLSVIVKRKKKLLREKKEELVILFLLLRNARSKMCTIFFLPCGPYLFYAHTTPAQKIGTYISWLTSP